MYYLFDFGDFSDGLCSALVWLGFWLWFLYCLLKSRNFYVWILTRVVWGIVILLYYFLFFTSLVSSLSSRGAECVYSVIQNVCFVSWFTFRAFSAFFNLCLLALFFSCLFWLSRVIGGYLNFFFCCYWGSSPLCLVENYSSDCCSIIGKKLCAC